ncbi:Spastin [Orbilia brochopaga]|nr:Spastin [Drechslerella brochopaga]
MSTSDREGATQHEGFTHYAARQVHIPKWFLEYNVKTHEELQSTKVLPQLPRDVKDCGELSAEQEFEGTWQHEAVLLAKNLGMDLISLSWDDFLDIELHLLLQRSLNSPYESPKAPSFQETITTIIKSAKWKRASAGHLPSSTTAQSCKVLLHLKGTYEWSQTLNFSGQSRSRWSELFRTTSRLEAQRDDGINNIMANDTIILVLATHVPEYYQPEITVSANVSAIVGITPLKHAKTALDMEMESRLRHLKREIRRLNPKTLFEDVLAPQPAWDLKELGLSPEISPGRLHAVSKDAAMVIAGRTWNKPKLGLDEVREVIHQIHENERAIRIMKEREEIPPTPSEWEDECMDEEMDDMESHLRSCIVKPETLETNLHDVIMDEGVKVALRQILKPGPPSKISRKLLNLIQLRGALLYGPPGTGKTHLARAIAKELSLKIITISPADITSKWVGETEKYIKMAFVLARKHTPCILFIDEADALFSRRADGDKRWERAALAQFLQEIDGIRSCRDMPFVLIATNRPGDLDNAFIRRLPHKIRFGLPSQTERFDITQTLIDDDDLETPDLRDYVAAATKGFSGSDLRSLCGEALAILTAEKQDIESESESESGQWFLEKRHFEEALQRIRPSVSRESIDLIDKFAKEYSPPTKRVGQSEPSVEFCDSDSDSDSDSDCELRY